MAKMTPLMDVGKRRHNHVGWPSTFNFRALIMPQNNNCSVYALFKALFPSAYCNFRCIQIHRLLFDGELNSSVFTPLAGRNRLTVVNPELSG